MPTNLDTVARKLERTYKRLNASTNRLRKANRQRVLDELADLLLDRMIERNNNPKPTSVEVDNAGTELVFAAIAAGELTCFSPSVDSLPRF